VRLIGRTVEILGTVLVPDPCHRLRAESQSSDPASITVAVIATAGPEGCIGVISRIAYRYAASLPSGHVRLRLWYRYETAGWPTAIAADTSLVVP
jgi:hypothetical protein